MPYPFKKFIKFILLGLLVMGSRHAACELFDANDLAILDVSYKRQYIGNGLDVYLTKDSFYVPLIDFIITMELQIDVTPDGASGVQGDGETFSLQKNNNEWSVSLGNAPPKTLNASDQVIVEIDDLIYVKQEYVSDWFGVPMQLEFSESLLNIDFTKLVPVQERLARRNRKVSEQDYLEEPSLPILNQPYALLEVPSVDARVSYLASRHDDDRIEDYRSVLYSARTLGDFLGMSTETLISGSRDQGLVGGGVRMERFDGSRSMLGPLGLSQISIGDINTPGSELSGSGYGRGILIGNDIISGGKSRDIRDIEGDFYPEWEVELYLNNTLVGYKTTDSTGHYKFENVVLFQGVNRFTLKFYGPHGEKEEQERQIVVGDDPENEAPFRYSVSLSQPGKSVLNIDGRDTGANDDYRASFFGRFNVHQNFNFNFSLEEARVREESEVLNESADGIPVIVDPNENYEDSDIDRFYGAGIQMYFGGISLTLNGSIEERMRKVGGIGVSGTLGGAAIYAQAHQYSYIDGYKDRISHGNILNSYSLAINKRFNALSFVMNGNHEEYEGSARDTLDLGLSTRVGWLNWNNTLNYLEQSADEYEDVDEEYLKQLLGATFFSTSYRFADFRLGGVYSVEPNFEFTNANVSTAIRVSDNVDLDLSISHSLLNDESFYRIGLNWLADNFRITPSISYSDSGRWQGLLQLTTSLGKRTGRMGAYYKPASNPAITRGTVRSRLFEDANADGQYQLGETLLSGGEIAAVQARRKARSNQAGVAWLELMPSWERTDIAINSNSINEGYVALGRESFSVIPRPGRVTEVDIPFLKVGEIDGYVEIIDGDNSFPGVGIFIELVNSKGEIGELGRSDSGSYFNFALVKPGVYNLRVKDFTLIEVIPNTIVIDGKGNLVENVRILVEPKPYEDVIDDPFTSNKPIVPSIPAKLIELPEEKPEMDIETNETPVVPIFTGIADSVVEQTIEKSAAVAPIFVVPTVNQLQSDLAVPQPKPNKSQGSATTFWAVQTGSFSRQDSAQDLVDRIRQEGFSAQIQTVELASGRFHRVFAHGFLDKESAEDAKNSLDQAFKIKSIVKKM